MKTFTPMALRAMIPMAVCRDGYHAEFFQMSDLDEFFQNSDGDDIETPSRRERLAALCDVATAQRECDMSRHPNNIFFEITRLQTDFEQVFYEWVLTEAGERAHRCYQADLCCDENGDLDRDATVSYWLWLLYSYSPAQEVTIATMADKNKEWLAEDWAAPIRNAMGLLLSHRCINDEGHYHAEKTWEFWTKSKRALDQPYRNTLLGLNEEWVVPLQEWIMHKVLSS